MNEKLNYISDEELEQLILQVEQTELVEAPPYLMEEILEKLEFTEIRTVKTVAARKKEFYAYCFRVFASVAAAIALVFLLPELSGAGWQQASMAEGKRPEIPRWEEVSDAIPSREDVVLTGKTPIKEEVLDDTGLFEKVFRNAGWISKEENGI